MLRRSQFTTEQRIFMVNMKAQGDSYRVINNDFKKMFPFSGRDPSNMTIYRQKKKFDREGTVHNLNKGRSGRPLSALTPNNLQFDLQLFQLGMPLIFLYLLFIHTTLEYPTFS